MGRKESGSQNPSDPRTWKPSLSIFLHYFTGGEGGEYDTYRNPNQYDERQHSLLYRRDNLARGVADVLENNFPYTGDTEILDLGAGTGILTLELARRGGKSVTGLDLFPLPLEKLREKAHAEGLDTRINTVQGDMNDFLPFEDNSFHTIVSLRATRFVTNFDNWLDEARRVLKPDGGFVLPVFAVDTIPWKRHSNRGIFQPTRFKDVRRVIESNGFIINDKTSLHYDRAVDLTRGKRDVPFYYKPAFIVAQKVG